MPPLRIDYWIVPPKLRRFRRLRGSHFRLLDVGCGNHSPAVAKRWFPDCEYHGLDRDRYNNDASDYQLMDQFYSLDLDTSPLDSIPDDFFDVIVCAHVIEHLRNGLDVIESLARKLAPQGEIYLEFPSVRSLGLPSLPGTLNFCDDPTHVRCYTLAEVCNRLLASGLRIRRAGRRRDWAQLILTPVTASASLLRRGTLMGGRVWDLCGFADYVWGAKVSGAGPR